VSSDSIVKGIIDDIINTAEVITGNFSKSKMYCLCTQCIIVNSIQVHSEFGKFAYTAICMRKCTL
jgi:hypothetical protein